MKVEKCFVTPLAMCNAWIVKKIVTWKQRNFSKIWCDWLSWSPWQILKFLDVLSTMQLYWVKFNLKKWLYERTKKFRLLHKRSLLVKTFLIPLSWAVVKAELVRLQLSSTKWFVCQLLAAGDFTKYRKTRSFLRVLWYLSYLEKLTRESLWYV